MWWRDEPLSATLAYHRDLGAQRRVSGTSRSQRECATTSCGPGYIRRCTPDRPELVPGQRMVRLVGTVEGPSAGKAGRRTSDTPVRLWKET